MVKHKNKLRIMESLSKPGNKSSTQTYKFMISFLFKETYEKKQAVERK